MKLKALILLSALISGGARISAQDTLSVFVIGDVMMHSKQLDYDCRSFLDSIKGPALKADIAIANMEFSLGGEPYTGYPAFSTPDYYSAYVASCGFDVFLMANNHILDRGEAGMERTLKQYRGMKESIRFTGAAGNREELEATNPLMMGGKGISIALINATQISNVTPKDGWPYLSMFKRSELEQSFARAKEQCADFIIVLPHWGTEYQLLHDSAQKEWAEWFTGQGADLILGTHPHVVQDTTHINGTPVIYSVGNAVSNMSATNTRLEVAITLRFVRNNDGNKKMLEPQLRWMWCTLPGKLTDNYATIFIDEWIGKRDCWIDASDYDNMVRTLERVKKATGIE